MVVTKVKFAMNEEEKHDWNWYTTWQDRNRQFLFSKCHTFRLFKRKSNFLYAYGKITTFLALIFFTKLTTSPHCLKISFTLFHPNRVLLWKGETEIYLTKAFNAPLFTKLTSTEWIFVDVTCTKFYLDRIKSAWKGWNHYLLPWSETVF
jgi:hypothetical protein